LITLKFFATLIKAAGEKSYESSAASIASLLKEVEDRYGDGVQRYMKNCTVLVNGKNIGYLKGKRTKLNPGDEVSIFPPLAGG
jgi:molybdopterin synthase sulfur carrier subunit